MQTESTELGYWAVPPGGGPGVVILHDVWGLYDHFRDLARRLAAEGFVALAVDLYAPLGSPRVEEPGVFMRSLSDPDIGKRVQQAVDAVRAHPSLRGKVGVVGFCMGGTYALLAAAGVERVGAAAAFYGVLSHRHGLYYDPNGLDPAKKPREPVSVAGEIRVPFCAFYGTADPYVPIADIRELEAGLARSALPTEVTLYEGAGHAFANDTRPQAYRPDAAKDAWRRLLVFFRRHLLPDLGP